MPSVDLHVNSIRKYYKTITKRFIYYYKDIYIHPGISELRLLFQLDVLTIDSFIEMISYDNENQYTEFFFLISDDFLKLRIAIVKNNFDNFENNFLRYIAFLADINSLAFLLSSSGNLAGKLLSRKR